MWTNNLLCFRNDEFAIVVQESIKSFQDITWRQVELVKDYPVSTPQKG